MKEDPERLIQVFTEVLQLPASERGSYLDRACAGEDELRERVVGLLNSLETAGSFLEQPAGRLKDQAEGEVVVGAAPGDWIGRYKLLQQIGEGGWGVVFMAEQSEPVRRLVALKIIKPGMDTKNVIARFEAERQALAMMDHPNIAKVFDAGATESGRPYFVMELVKGIKLTEHCDQHALSTADRLELFIQVCHAVQHAHQKGIIHRDLKPSNILVTTTAEGKCQPKVIDFGIAKATSGERLTDKTLFTAFELMIGTPAYMSPEQAALTSEDVDTRADIYSLGALLYELLTSRTPFDTRELLKAGLDEVRRVIRHEEPVRPSARLSTMGAEALTSIANYRQVNAPRLIRALSGDLDWIVMKALEKDRSRRYQTASSLLQDVQHYLAGEAISARPPSTWYRFQKVVSRNKLLFISIATILLMLISGLIGAGWLLRNERTARRDAYVAKQQAEADKNLAQSEAAKSQQVTRFLEQMLQAVDPSVARGRDTTMLREILDRAADRIGTELGGQPAVEADLRGQIGKVYEDLGFYPQAEAIVRKALALRSTQFGKESLEAAASMHDLAHILLRTNQTKEAIEMSQGALAIRRRLLGNHDINVASSMDLLGQALWMHGKLSDAEGLMRDSLALRREFLAEKHPDIASSLNGLGNVLYDQEKYREAEPLYRAASKMYAETLGDENTNTTSALQNLSSALYRLGNFAESEAIGRDVVARRRSMLGDQHPSYARSLSGLADALMQQRKWPDAEAAYRELLSLERKSLAEDDPEIFRVRDNLAYVILHGHKYEDAERMLKEILTLEFLSSPRSARFQALNAEFLARRERWGDAISSAAKALDYEPGDHQYYHTLAPLLVAQRDVSNYRNLCDKIVARFAATTDPYTAERMAKDCLVLPRSVADLQSVAKMADTAVTVGQGDRALPHFKFCKALAEYRLGHFEAAAEWAEKVKDTAWPHLRVEATAVYAMARFQLGQKDDASAHLASLTKVLRDELPTSGQDLGNDWRDWIIANALAAEARQLIEGIPSTKDSVERP